MLHTTVLLEVMVIFSPKLSPSRSSGTRKRHPLSLSVFSHSLPGLGSSIGHFSLETLLTILRNGHCSKYIFYLLRKAACVPFTDVEVTFENESLSQFRFRYRG